MKFIQLSKEKKLSDQAVTTLVIHAIYQFGNSLSLIFLNLYLWRLTNSLVINGLFNLVAILAQALMTLYIGKIAKRKDRLQVYRFGISLTALFYLFIVIAQEKMIDYVFLFALLKGISQALYWLGYFTLVHEISTNDNRHRYLGWNQIVMSTSNLVGPAVAGFIISVSNDLSGYLLVFSLAFIMFVISTYSSLRIKKQKYHHKEYYMKYLNLILQKKPAFFRTLVGWFVIGFPQGILMYIPPILLYNIFLDEGIVGYLNVLFLSLSIISSYIFSRIAKIDSTRTYLLIAACGFTFSAFFLLSGLSIWTVVLFLSIHSIFKPIQANSYAAYYFKWIDILPLKENFRVESVVLRETIINIGRTFGIIFFMMFSKGINASTVAFVIIAVMLIQFLIPLLTKESNREDMLPIENLSANQR